MSTMYVVMFVDIEVPGRNTSIIAVCNCKEKAERSVTDHVRSLFGAEDSPIVEEDEEEGSYFLIQSFNQIAKGCWGDDEEDTV